MDGEGLYNVHRVATEEMLGWVIPTWNELDWNDQIRWHDRAVEHGLSDSGKVTEIGKEFYD